MKTLQIQQSARTLDRASRSISAPVVKVSEKACLSVGIAAVVALFVSLGLMCVPAIVASGLTAILSVAVSPYLSKKGGAS